MTITSRQEGSLIVTSRIQVEETKTEALRAAAQIFNHDETEEIKITKVTNVSADNKI